MTDKPCLTIDVEANRTRHLVMMLYHNILHDYVARANEQDVLEGLHKFFTENDIAVIPKMQLKQYQEMEKTILAASPLEFKNG